MDVFPLSLVVTRKHCGGAEENHRKIKENPCNSKTAALNLRVCGRVGRFQQPRPRHGPTTVKESLYLHLIGLQAAVHLLSNLQRSTFDISHSLIISQMSSIRAAKSLSRAKIMLSRNATPIFFSSSYFQNSSGPSFS